MARGCRGFERVFAGLFNLFFLVIFPREGWELATEVAWTARQHPDKRAYKRNVFLPSYRDGGSPKTGLLVLSGLMIFYVFLLLYFLPQDDKIGEIDSNKKALSLQKTLYICGGGHFVICRLNLKHVS